MDEIVNDVNGRAFKLRKLSGLEQSRIVRIVGGDDAMNPAYMTGYVMPATSVAEIDGDPVAIPATKLQIEAIIQRLDQVGIDAILNYLIAKANDAAKKAEEDQQLKN